MSKNYQMRRERNFLVFGMLQSITLGAIIYSRI